jgi:hypothetical protein
MFAMFAASAFSFFTGIHLLQKIDGDAGSKGSGRFCMLLGTAFMIQGVVSWRKRNALEKKLSDVLAGLKDKTGKRFPPPADLENGFWKAIPYAMYGTTLKVVIFYHLAPVLEALKTTVRFSIKRTSIQTFTDWELCSKELTREEPHLLVMGSWRNPNDPSGGDEMLRILTERKAQYPIFVLAAYERSEAHLRQKYSGTNLNITFFCMPVRADKIKAAVLAALQLPDVEALEKKSREMLGPAVWYKLEDATWSNNLLKEDHLHQLYIAYLDLKQWPSHRLKRVVETIAIHTVSRIFGEMNILPAGIREKCQRMITLDQSVDVTTELRHALLYSKTDGVMPMDYEAADQMTWVVVEANWGAIRAAWALAGLATVAANVADWARKNGAAPDAILCKACRIWIEAANETHEP